MFEHSNSRIENKSQELTSFWSVMVSKVGRKLPAQTRLTIFEQQMSNGIGLELQAKGLNAPRITPDHVEANILKEHYINAGSRLQMLSGIQRTKRMYLLNLLTICVLVLKTVSLCHRWISMQVLKILMLKLNARSLAKMQSTKFGHWWIRTEIEIIQLNLNAKKAARTMDQFLAS